LSSCRKQGRQNRIRKGRDAELAKHLARSGCALRSSIWAARCSQLTGSQARSNSCLDKLCSMKRWQFSILIFELALFAVILVLPQVALPDFTFHDGTAPVTAHSRLCDRAPATGVAVAPQILPLEPITRAGGQIPDVPAPPAVHSRLSQLCVLIC
jgi:hypothetical protein